MTCSLFKIALRNLIKEIMEKTLLFINKKRYRKVQTLIVFRYGSPTFLIFKVIRLKLNTRSSFLSLLFDQEQHIILLLKFSNVSLFSIFTDMAWVRKEQTFKAQYLFKYITKTRKLQHYGDTLTFLVFHLSQDPTMLSPRILGRRSQSLRA